MMDSDSEHISISSTEEPESKANKSDPKIAWARNKLNPLNCVVLRESDFLRLECGKWLNDNLLDYGFFTLSQCLRSNDVSKVQLFPTFFYTKLVSGAAQKHADIRKWTKNINIFDKPIHIYPINEAEHHWYIIVVVFPTDNNKPYMAVLDSNSKDDGKERVIQNIKNYLTEELQSKSVKSISRKLLEEMETIYPKIPQQQDGSSCGLYALYFVKEIFKRVMFGSLNLMFDDISSWHQHRNELETLRYELAKEIKNTGISQGYGDVKLPDLQYFPTAAEDKAFKSSMLKTQKVFFDASDNMSEKDSFSDTASDLPYQEYLKKQEENQLDYSFIWSRDGLYSSDDESL